MSTAGRKIREGALQRPPNIKFDGLIYIICKLIFGIIEQDMAKKESTSVYYHVPEDKDSPQQPNYFAIPESKASLRLEHIYEYFPLRGTYIFRFKLAHDGFVVWLDINDLSARVPTFKDSVVIKANRISWEDSKLNLVKTAKDTFKIAEVKQIKKETVNLFDQHEGSHRYGSAKSAKNIHEDKLGGGESHGGHANLLDEFTTASQVPSNINFFDADAGKNKEKVASNLMGFEKHSDLI